MKAQIGTSKGLDKKASKISRRRKKFRAQTPDAIIKNAKHKRRKMEKIRKASRRTNRK